MLSLTYLWQLSTSSLPSKLFKTRWIAKQCSITRRCNKYMATVDSRLEDLHSHIKGYIGDTSGTTVFPESSLATDSGTGSSESPPFLRQLKMEVPWFDGFNPGRLGVSHRRIFRFPWHPREPSASNRVFPYGGLCRILV